MSLIRLSFILIFLISSTKCDKSSLTFVIDDTNSMTDDIDTVKKGADQILSIMLDKKSSQIENLILVTVNDPPVQDVNTITKDSNEFRRALNALYTYNYNNYDCAEPSLHGIELALEKSLPGSEIFVFTDASAKDHNKLNIVTNLCQKKQSRVTFVLTGNCRLRSHNPSVKVFYEIASACSGEVFNIYKNDIPQLFPYFRENNGGSKTTITSKTVPSNTWTYIDFMVDDKAEYVLISVSGENVKLELNGPTAFINQERITWLSNVKVLKLINPIPGAYKIKVWSSTYASVIAFARTDFTFVHGFSEFTPKSMKDTTAQPIKGVKSHLSVLVADVEHSVQIKAVEILDTDENLIREVPLTNIGEDLYTTATQLWPVNRFKVAVIGITNSGQRIRRIAKTPVEPQKPKEPDSKSPVVTIGEGKATNVAYNGNLTLTCRVSAYPQPNIVWKDGKGNKLPAKSFTLEPPYEYRSNLYLQNVKTPNKYSCYAINNQGKSAVQAIAVSVDSPFFNNDDHIRGITKIKYGDVGILKCNIKSKLPMQITWKFFNHIIKNWKIIRSSPKYTTSADGTQLKINYMDLDAEGQYTCEATLTDDRYKGPIYKTDVKITGIFKPKLEKKSSVIKAMVNDSVVISCRTTAGIPKPNIQFQFKAANAHEYVDRKLINGEMRIKAGLSDNGHYKCTAENSVGWDEQIHELIVNAAPIITTVKSDFYGVENDIALRLPCETTGNPKPILSWKRNGTNITPDTKYKITSDGHLIINKPMRIDTDTYSCTASNDFGTAEKNYTVIVTEYLDDDTYGNTRNVFEVADKPLKLECSLPINDNDKVQWFLNGLDMNVTNRFIHFSKPNESHDGNYTCRVSNENGSVSETYNVDFGYSPKFRTDDDVPITHLTINWDGEDECLSCDVKAKPTAEAAWMYNGNKVGDSSLSLIIGGWGSYSCLVTNVHGSIQRTFNVTSKNCMIQKKTKLNNMPLIISETSSWPDFQETPKFIQISQEQSLQLLCRSDSKQNNNFKNFNKSHISAICDHEDRFLIEGRLYKISDLQCNNEVLPTINKTGVNCLKENTEMISVGFNVAGLTDVYEVCFDKAKNIPIYTKLTTSSFITRDDDSTMKWYNERDISNNAFDKSYNCSEITVNDASSTCCYAKKQLVNSNQVTYGPAQRATFINQLNAIPVWIPCHENIKHNTWSTIENAIDDNAEVWSGVYKVESIQGSLVPRYLWKVIWTGVEYMTVVHVNSPAPTDEDILCNNTCNDAEWSNVTTFCCKMTEFLRAFDLPLDIFHVPSEDN